MSAMNAHRYISCTYDTYDTYNLMSAISAINATDIYRGGVGTYGMNAQNSAKRNRPIWPFDARLIRQNALDIISTHFLGENAIKNRNLSPFLSPSAYSTFGKLRYILFILSNLTQSEVVHA